MPVHKVKGGYKWGKTGKTYPTKKQAERQARAIYANGYEGVNEVNNEGTEIPKNMNRKNTIRLTESDLKNIISESVKNIISELDYKTYANAASASKDKDDKFRGYPSKQSSDLYDYAFVTLSRQVCGEDDFALFLAKYIPLHGVDNKIQKMMQQYTDGQKYIQNNQTKWSKK